MFQHRHYKAIAAVLADIRDENERLYGGGSVREQTTDRIEGKLIKLFAADNEGFNPDRFLAAATRSPKMHGKDRVV